MSNIKYNIEKKIRYFFLAMINNKDGDLNNELLMEKIPKLRESWESLLFIEKNNIELQVEGFENFTYEQNEPFYDGESKIYYKNDTDYDDFYGVIIEFFKTTRTLEGDFKYILTKDVEKIKTTDKDQKYLEQIDRKWLHIESSQKNAIVEKLKDIGFKNNIIFSLIYNSNNYQCVDENKMKTQQEVQEEINKILKEFNLEECVIKIFSSNNNKLSIDKIRNKYLKLDYPIENEGELRNKMCLNEDDIYNAMGTTKDIIDKELEEANSENIVNDFRIDKATSKETKKIKKKDHCSISTTTSVDIFSKRSNNILESKGGAKKRGLAIEKFKVDSLSNSFKNAEGEIREEAKKIFEKMKNEKLLNSKIFRFSLKSNNYQKILENGSLKDILHVSKNLGDGVGFDIFYPERNNNGKIKLFKVEIKSSSAGKTIYLTENERKQILLYKEKGDQNFRVYLYKKEDDPKDITGIVYEILEANNSFSNINAETWILDVETIN